MLIKGGSEVHVSRPQRPGLNKDHGFSLLQTSASAAAAAVNRRSLKRSRTAVSHVLFLQGLLSGIEKTED